MGYEPEPGQPEPGAPPAARGPAPGKLVIVLRVVLPISALAVGLIVALWLVSTPPEAKPRVKSHNAALVDVRPVEYDLHQIRVSAMGTVRPKREVTLQPQVNGEIVELGAEFQPGGFFSAGGLLLKIDDTDYRLAVEQLTSEVARAEAELQLEQGNQLVALKEFELLGEPVSDEEKRLMLRQPQLENLRAALNVARSKLEQARINLQRTEVRAPFNALVLSRQVNLGTRVTTGSELARLVGTDAYWVEVSVPVSQLRWIDIPQSQADPGAQVRVYDRAAWGEDRFRGGRVARLSAAIEEKGRMARLLVEVDDPLSLHAENRGQPGLLLNSYVRVEIEGKQLASTAAISRDYLHEKDTVWIMDQNDQLDIRAVEIVFRGETEVYIASGVEPGERLVTTVLPAPVQGMPLRLAAESGAQVHTDEGDGQKQAGDQ